MKMINYLYKIKEFFGRGKSDKRVQIHLPLEVWESIFPFLGLSDQRIARINKLSHQAGKRSARRLMEIHFPDDFKNIQALESANSASIDYPTAFVKAQEKNYGVNVDPIFLFAMSVFKEGNVSDIKRLQFFLYCGLIYKRRHVTSIRHLQSNYPDQVKEHYLIDASPDLSIKIPLTFLKFIQESTDKNGINLIQWAHRNNNKILLNYLYGEMINHLKDLNDDHSLMSELDSGFTPLHAAIVFMQSIEEIKRVMPKSIENRHLILTMKTKCGETPLHMAIGYNRENVVEALFPMLAPEHISEKLDGMTPLMMAIQVGNMNMVRFLCQNGFEVDAVLFIDQKKVTAVSLAVNLGRYDMVECLCQYSNDIPEWKEALLSALTKDDKNLFELICKKIGAFLDHNDVGSCYSIIFRRILLIEPATIQSFVLFAQPQVVFAINASNLEGKLYKSYVSRISNFSLYYNGTNLFPNLLQPWFNCLRANDHIIMRDPSLKVFFALCSLSLTHHADDLPKLARVIEEFIGDSRFPGLYTLSSCLKHIKDNIEEILNVNCTGPTSQHRSITSSDFFQHVQFSGDTSLHQGLDSDEEEQQEQKSIFQS